MINPGKYSFGIGDRFGLQGAAQLSAIIEAGKKGIEITPVWNKSNREHIIVGSQPEDVRREADEAVNKTGFKYPYYVDADHINKDTVDRFIEYCDFFTIDVAAYIGRKAPDDDIKSFVETAKRYTGDLKIPGIANPFNISAGKIILIAEKYLYAAENAQIIYGKIEHSKGKGNFITEISIDEVSESQTPEDLFFILKMLGDKDIPVQTIAPKFSGRFNKGIDYKGDIEIFAREFEENLMVIDHAANEFGLPPEIKMSIHSGSDKFSIYPRIGSLLKKHNKGIHIKTAGTTWLEEITGLAGSGGKGLKMVKEIYFEAVQRADELCAPYADVIDINISGLPSEKEVSGWDGLRFADAVRHIPGNRYFSPDMRQLIHVAYKLAAERKSDFTDLVRENEERIAQDVFENIYNRHICRLFGIS